MAFSDEMIAQILVEAAFHGDQPTIEKYGISRMSLHRWKQKLDKSDSLLQIVTVKSQKFSQGWESEAPSAITECVNFMKRAAQTADSDNPDMVHAVAGAMKIMNEALVMREVLNARLNQQTRYINAEN